MALKSFIESFLSVKYKAICALFLLINTFFSLEAQISNLDLNLGQLNTYHVDSALHRVVGVEKADENTLFVLVAQYKFIKTSSTPEQNTLLIKCDSAGVFDKNFGLNGVLTIAFNSFPYSIPTHLFVNSGYVYVSGIAFTSLSKPKAKTIKLTIDGVRSASFGLNGELTHDLNSKQDVKVNFYVEGVNQYTYGSSIYEIAGETHEFQFVRKYQNQTIDVTFGYQGTIIIDLSKKTTYSMPNARVLHAEGGRINDVISQGDYLVFCGYNFLDDGPKSAVIFKVHKANGTIDKNIGDKGTLDIYGQVALDNEALDFEFLNNEFWLALDQYKELETDFEWYNLNNNEFYKLDFDNRVDRMKDMAVLKDKLVFVGESTSAYKHLNNPFASEKFALALYDTKSKTVLSKVLYSPTLGFDEYGASHVHCFNSTCLVAGFGYKGYTKDLVLSQWTMDQLLQIEGKNKPFLLPNSFNQNSNLDLIEYYEKVELFDLNGRVVFEGINVRNISFHYLNSGIYFLNLNSEKFNHVMKIWVNEF